MEFLSKLHPIVIHFPIVLFIFYIFLELVNLHAANLSIKKTSLLILFFGVIGGIVSVLTGNQSFQVIQSNPVLTQLHRIIISEHEYYATITVWYFFVILVFQIFQFLKNKKQVRKQYIFIIFAVVGLYLIYQTAKIGGQLVYKFGIGTDLFK